MGLPMARRLIADGYTVHGSDVSREAIATLQNGGGKGFGSPQAAVANTDIVVLMLPNSAIVRDVVFGEGGIATAIKAGSLIIDMGSSNPVETQLLSTDLAKLGLALVDAPVSGGVKRAEDGTLAIMAGGNDADIQRVLDLFLSMGRSVIPTGPVGSAHAAKALNNYVSAAGLAAACEAAIVAREFGIDPEVFVDVLNISTGRNNATEHKMKPFVLSGSFASGFSMALMAKDLGIAAKLASALNLEAEGIRATANQWAAASKELGLGADHTEIARVLARPPDENALRTFHSI